MIDQSAADELRQTLSDRLENSPALSDIELREWIDDGIFSHPVLRSLTSARKKIVAERIFYSFRGLDILQPLLDDPEITEIMINHHEEIFIERKGAIHRSDIRFESLGKLEDVIQSIVAKVNRVVNVSTPIVDARLSDGSRVHVVLPPVALKGPAMTIRKFPEQPMTMENLITLQAIDKEAAGFLKSLVEAKYNIFIGGGTGSGKTTFLNALAQWIPQDERIVTIEDSAELRLRNIDNLVGLETRNANTEGRGEITIRELIRASLRMRPNRIIVGEVRGPEALDMLQAMNTGHDGSLSTGHANSAADMMSRLETMVLSGADLPLVVVRKQIASALDIVIHLSRLRDKSRKVTEIHEVVGLRDGEIELVPLYRFVEDTEGGADRLTGRLLKSEHSLQNTGKLQNAGIRLE